MLAGPAAPAGPLDSLQSACMFLPPQQHGRLNARAPLLSAVAPPSSSSGSRSAHAGYPTALFPLPSRLDALLAPTYSLLLALPHLLRSPHHDSLTFVSLLLGPLSACPFLNNCNTQEQRSRDTDTGDSGSVRADNVGRPPLDAVLRASVPHSDQSRTLIALLAASLGRLETGAFQTSATIACHRAARLILDIFAGRHQQDGEPATLPCQAAHLVALPSCSQQL